MNKPSVSVEIWGPSELRANLAQASALRIQVFRDFPYLYEGDLTYEQNYLQVYLNSPRSVLVAARDQGQLVGLSSALPLLDETSDVQKPFLEAGLDLSKVFYFGESILLSNYRGLGLGHRFFDEREKSALSHPQFSITCFCAVERPEDHPLRPPGYKPLHEFWRKRGYHLAPSLKTQFSWRDIGESKESLKTMQFWLKEWVR